MDRLSAKMLKQWDAVKASPNLQTALTNILGFMLFGLLVGPWGMIE